MVCIADECEKNIQTFNMLKRSDVDPTNQPENTRTILKYSLINSIDNTSPPIPRKCDKICLRSNDHRVIADIKDVHCI